MAQTKTSSGNVTTYVITDTEGSSVTVVLTNLIGGGRVLTFSSSGNLHQDGAQLLSTLMQMLSTGLTP
jgi:nitrate/nitrite-specific signal transduction histidine kinase